MSLTLFLLIIGCVILALIVSSIRQKVKEDQEKRRLQEERQQLAEELRRAYDEALRSGNKMDALAAGRAYYSHLRDGQLTLFDEQAIANDLSAMS
ncbi:hypothetical protein [Niabella sp.]|uniref:hypothetical protein n=1 Tax=Niabella sp. TaxID=1962976 RepID=UPI002628A217|nr:hypothetical protein [Niabella sp.]